MGYPPPDHKSQALQGVNRRACAGCGRSFLPTRASQVDCRPSCRVLALRSAGRYLCSTCSPEASPRDMSTLT
jgi:DNA-directed RNA polymerase subunit RPC12/RpoP